MIIRLLLLLTLIVTALGAAAEEDRGVIVKSGASASRVALVVGNSTYRSSPLDNPVNDASDIASALQQLNFTVSVVLDADFATMSAAVTRFGRQIEGGADVALFYYAGHGMQVGGRNFLLPVDVELEHEDELAYKSVDAGLVLGKMDAASSRTNIMILDACRNNPFARSFRSASRGLAQMDAPNGTLIVYATAPGDVAADGTGRNGVFTEKLLQHIATPGLDVELMLRRVRVDVLAATNQRQTPWTASSLRSNFAFLGEAESLNVTATRLTLTPATIVKLPADTDVELDASARLLAVTAIGRSEAADSAARRIEGKKNADRRTADAIKAYFKQRGAGLSRSELRQLTASGELVDLEYLDDGKAVQVVYEIPLSATQLSALGD